MDQGAASRWRSGGLFIDDKRDPQQRVNIVADRGTVVKNERGSFLILEDGNLQRFEVGEHDPVLVVFKSYAFDMSQFSSGPQNVTYNVHERLTPELLSPPKDDPLMQTTPGAFRAEFHDRIFAPLYPFVFALMAFAFLGMPRTTRQSRNFAISSMLLVVLVLRIAGFACSTISVNFPIAVVLQYLMLLVVGGASVWMIIRGIAVEPPSNVINMVTRLAERLVPARLRQQS